MALPDNRSAIYFPVGARTKSEFSGNTRIKRLLGAAIGYHAHSVSSWRSAVIETEAVLPIAVGITDIDQVRVFRTRHQFSGVHQTSQFGVDFDSGGQR